MTEVANHVDIGPTLYFAMVSHGWRVDGKAWSHELRRFGGRIDSIQGASLEPNEVSVILHLPGPTWAVSAEGIRFDSEGVRLGRFSAKRGWEAHVKLPEHGATSEIPKAFAENLRRGVLAAQGLAQRTGRARDFSWTLSLIDEASQAN